jgi:hypothetical protein
MKGNTRGIPNEVCQEKYRNLKLGSLPQGIKDSQICAAGRIQADGVAVDTCQGRRSEKSLNN